MRRELRQSSDGRGETFISLLHKAFSEAVEIEFLETGIVSASGK
jgi:hypothetical protein